MSSILDALKKSEAERQRGSPPTPTSPLVFRSQPAPRRRPPWLLPVLAAAALLLAWAGGMFQFGGESSPDDAPTGLAMAPDAGSTAGGDGAPVAAPAPSTPTPPPVPGAVAPAPPQPTPVEGAALPAPEASDGQPEVRPLRGFIDPGRTERPPPQTVTPPLIEDPAAPGNAGAAQPPAAAAPAPPVAPANGNGPPSLYDLPFDVRRGLPPLAVTMHMYSSDPGRRFALINGHRVHDGETMDDGVEVVEIRADGIVVRHEGTEFVLPARG